MYEASKAALRRGRDYPYIKGNVLDIGCGADIVTSLYEGITQCRGWDLPDGDAQYLKGVANHSYDCVHSSHSLEHMVHPVRSLRRWIQVVKPGGYLVVTVPDEEMYERLQWPSVFNGDHKWSFSTYWRRRLPRSVNVLKMIKKLRSVELVHLQRITHKFNPDVPGDQTLGEAECCIEFVLKKVAP